MSLVRSSFQAKLPCDMGSSFRAGCQGTLAPPCDRYVSAGAEICEEEIYEEEGRPGLVPEAGRPSAAALAAVDVEGEVLLGDGVIDAVGADGGDRLVQPLLQRLVGLAHPAADAIAEDDVIVLRRRRLDLEVLTLGGLQELRQVDGIGHLEIDAARDEIRVDVVLGVIGLDGYRRAEILLHEAEMGGRDLDSDDLALEAVRVLEIDVIGD